MFWDSNKIFKDWPNTKVKPDKIVVDADYYSPHEVNLVIDKFARKKKVYVTVQFTKEKIRIRSESLMWSEFDRNMQYGFSAEAHEKAEEEAWEEAIVRVKNPHDKKKRHFRDSYHVFLEHVQGRHYLPDAYDRKTASLLVNRLNSVGQYIVNQKPFDKPGQNNDEGEVLKMPGSDSSPKPMFENFPRLWPKGQDWAGVWIMGIFFGIYFILNFSALFVRWIKDFVIDHNLEPLFFVIKFPPWAGIPIFLALLLLLYLLYRGAGWWLNKAYAEIDRKNKVRGQGLNHETRGGGFEPEDSGSEGYYPDDFDWERDYSHDDDPTPPKIPENKQEDKNPANRHKKEEKPKDFEEESLGGVIPEASKRKQGDPLKELDNMIGLQSVKEQVKSIMAIIANQQRRKKHGLPVNARSYHMVFSGNPGTGKTTVARIMADILYDLGVIKKGGVIELDRSKIVGAFVGHTENKLKLILKKTMGRVLFIDEAYTLYDQKAHSDPDGKKMVDQLNKVLEDDRDKFVAILAGYEKEMDELLETNPGLKSRVPLKIHFPDYSPDELFEIFESLCRKGKYVLTEAAEKKVKWILEKIYENRGESFGNGRTVRNLFEKTQSKQDLRTAAKKIVSKKELMTIREEDVPSLTEMGVREDGEGGASDGPALRVVQ